MNISAELIAAYRHSRYTIDEWRLYLQVDAIHPEIDQRVAALGHETYAYMTAWNPYSIPRPDAENQRSQAELVSELAKIGHPYLTGQSISHDHSWPPEPSLFIFGIPQTQAIALATHFEQNAILYGHLHQTCHLILCR